MLLEYTNGFERANLSFRNLTLFPKLTRCTTKNFDLTGNNLSHIVKDNLPQQTGMLLLSYNNLYNCVDEYIDHLNIVTLFLNNNLIKKFDGVNYKSLKNLSLSYNFIKNNNFVFPPNIMVISVSNCKLSELKQFPKTLINADCSHNFLDNMLLNDGLLNLNCSFNELRDIIVPNTLSILICNNNKISKLPPLKDTCLTFINLSHNLLQELPEFPYSLQTLIVAYNSLLILHDLNYTQLSYIDVSHNNLTELCNFPEYSMKHIYASHNKLTHIGGIPPCVKIIDFSYNRISTVDELPRLLSKADFSNNVIINFPDDVITMIHYINKLDLSNNMITKMPRYFRYYSKNIKIDNNYVDTVDEDVEHKNRFNFSRHDEYYYDMEGDRWNKRKHRKYHMDHIYSPYDCEEPEYYDNYFKENVTKYDAKVLTDRQKKDEYLPQNDPNCVSSYNSTSITI